MWIFVLGGMPHQRPTAIFHEKKGSVLSSRHFYFDGGLIWNVESLYVEKPSGLAGPSESQTVYLPAHHSCQDRRRRTHHNEDREPVMPELDCKMGWDGSST